MFILLVEDSVLPYHFSLHDKESGSTMVVPNFSATITEMSSSVIDFISCVPTSWLPLIEPISLLPVSLYSMTNSFNAFKFI